MKTKDGKEIKWINPEHLRWGYVCKTDNNHRTGQGRTLKHPVLGCIQCAFGDHKSGEEWLIEFQNTPKPPMVKDLPEEELKKRRSQNSMRWAKRNPEKLKSYVKKYYTKEETKEKNKEKYAAIPWEIKHERYLKVQERKKALAAAKEQDDRSVT